MQRQTRELKAAGAEEIITEREHGDAKTKQALDLLLKSAECGDTLGAADRYRAEHSEDGDGTDPKKKKKKGLFG